MIKNLVNTVVALVLGVGSGFLLIPLLFPCYDYGICALSAQQVLVSFGLPMVFWFLVVRVVIKKIWR